MSKTEYKYDESGKATELKVYDNGGKVVFWRRKQGGIWVTVLDVRGGVAPKAQDPTPGFGEISKEELVGSGGTVRDIREYESGKGPGSAAAPEGQLERLTKVRPEKGAIVTTEIGRGGTVTKTPIQIEVTEFKGGQPVRRGTGTGLITERDPITPSALRPIAKPIDRDVPLATMEKKDEGFAYGFQTTIGGEIETLTKGQFTESRVVQTGSAAVIFTISDVFSNVLITQPHPIGKGLGLVIKGAMLVFAADVAVGTASYLTSKSFSDLPEERKGEIAGLLALDIASFTIAGTATKYVASKGAGTIKIKTTKKVGDFELEGDIIVGPSGKLQFRPDIGGEPGAVMMMSPAIKVISDSSSGGGTNALFGTIVRKSTGQLTIQHMTSAQLPLGTIVGTGSIYQPVLLTETLTRPAVKFGFVTGVGSLGFQSQIQPQAQVGIMSQRASQAQTQRLSSGQGSRQELSFKMGSFQALNQGLSFGSLQSASQIQGLQSSLMQGSLSRPRRQSTSQFAPAKGMGIIPDLEFEFPKALGKKSTAIRMPSSKYSPSLEAVLFNIKGKQPKILTGFEVRPIRM